MGSLVKLGITALAVLSLVVGNAGLGWAGISCTPCVVKIDDLTEIPSVKVFSGAFDATSNLLSPQPDNNPSGEFLHFTLLGGLDPPEALSPAVVASVYVDLFEDRVGGTLSDRLLITRVGSNLDVEFASDPASIVLPPGAFNALNLVENGDFQSLFTIDTAPAGTLGPAVGGFAYDFQVRSDVDVPAPATLLLVGSGLAGLGALGWRRKRG